MPITTPPKTTLTALTPRFLLYVEVELAFSKESLIKYRDCLRYIIRVLGDRDIAEITAEELLALKGAMLQRSLSVSRQVGVLSTLKRLLQYAQSHLKLPVMNHEEIIMPKRPRREVVFLTPEEVARFVGAIHVQTYRGKASVQGLRFRAVVEMLLGSAMRISELLSLNRRDVDFQNREAKVIGKGNKQRVVFFTERALSWLTRYLEVRTDDHEALFATVNGKHRLVRTDLWRSFKIVRARARIEKPVRPHLLRHTAATQLLFNGCPIGHIKEILGHERLETTCRYYLGLDRRAAKQAHQRFLTYETTQA